MCECLPLSVNISSNIQILTKWLVIRAFLSFNIFIHLGIDNAITSFKWMKNTYKAKYVHSFFHSFIRSFTRSFSHIRSLYVERSREYIDDLCTLVNQLHVLLNIEPMLVWFWPTVCEAGTTLNQHRLARRLCRERQLNNAPLPKWLKLKHFKHTGS